MEGGQEKTNMLDAAKWKFIKHRANCSNTAYSVLSLISTLGRDIIHALFMWKSGKFFGEDSSVKSSEA